MVVHLSPLHQAAEGSTPQQGAQVGQAEPLWPTAAFGGTSQTDCEK